MNRMLLLTTALLLTACIFDKKSASDTKHDLERPTNDDSPFQWLDVSAADFEEKVLNGLLSDPSGTTPPTITLSQDDAITKRVQFWLDALDKGIRTRHPKELAMVPKPKAIVTQTSEINAFVSPVGECLNMTVKMQKDLEKAPTAAEIKAAPALDKIIFDRSVGEFSDGSPYPCMTSKFSIKDKKEFIKWSLAPYPECKYRIYGDALVVTPGCKVSSDVPMPVGTVAKSLMLMRTASYITVMAGIVAPMNEKELVAILAHELGHYYMSHVTAPAQLYGYMYTLGAHNPGSKPVYDPSTDKLAAEVMDAMKRMADGYPLAKVADQKYHTSLFGLATSIASSLKTSACSSVSEGATCDSKCVALDELLEKVTSEDLLGDFPYNDMPESGLPYYRSYEDLMGSCLEDVSNVAKIGQIEVDMAKDIMMQTATYVDSNLFIKALNDQTFADSQAVWNRLNEMVPQLILERDADIKETFQKAFDNHLAFYTTEQEADEISLEWLTHIGIEPIEGLKSEFTFLRLFGDEASSESLILETSAKDCETLYGNDWRDENDVPVMIPIGDWEEPHHSSCYRAFNVSREIEVHNYNALTLPAAPIPTDGLTWAEIQAQAKAIAELPEPVSTPVDSVHVRKPGKKAK